jgi:hypothetical protein
MPPSFAIIAMPIFETEYLKLSVSLEISTACIDILLYNNASLR